MLSLFKFRRVSPVSGLYQAIEEASRLESFYAQKGVPDTIDGRFALIVLHSFLILRRLRGQNEKMAQELFDLIFAQIDINLREKGVGDVGLSLRLRSMAESLYGSLAAYESGLKEQDDNALHLALRHNLFGSLIEPPSREVTGFFVDYLRANAELSVDDILRGKVEFHHV